MNYILEKLINLGRKKFLPHVSSAVISNTKSSLQNYDEICFYFDDPSLMHLGDHLYFIPLIKKLSKVNIKISIAPTQMMQFAFTAFPIFDPAKKIKRLIVSRVELYPIIQKIFGRIDYFLYDTMSPAIDSPISNYILKTFCEYYSLSSIDQTIYAKDYLNFEISLKPEFDYLKNKNLIFLNNYVDSGKFRVSKKRTKILLDHLKIIKKNNFVIHLGSEKDKQKDTRDYTSIIDLDLRGKTSIQDLFSLLSLDSIYAVYCHDTFIMHVANLFNHPIYVCFKKYFCHNDQKQNAFSSLFVKDKTNFHYL